MAELREHRLKRLHMRSIRRGIKEMDLILTKFSEMRLATLSDEELDLYEALLAENDQDLYVWVSGQDQAPEQFRQMIADIYDNHVGHGQV
ncbi:MAG: succinate dehydrogenase assembly factor 2 [Rhodobacteraceae bacterium]|nr:succinate dehydrogenase assembly factor 2 [Paracoccaceae bacterium]